MDKYGDYPLAKWEYLGFTLSFTVSVHFSYSTKMHKAIEEENGGLCVSQFLEEEHFEI